MGLLEFRCPIYGFIPLDDWEYEIISQPAFQRLRRIRQLAWTDYVYPGAMHTRFEHSLGVMHMATMLYDGVADRSEQVLRDDLGYNKAGIERYKKLVRLAALLHDVGHSPFSHAAEELAPSKGNKKYRHEEYSSAIIKGPLRDAIENHRFNSNFGFKAEDIANLIEGSAAAGRAAIWQELISGQVDADRMDCYAIAIIPESSMANTIGGASLRRYSSLKIQRREALGLAFMSLDGMLRRD